MNECKVRILIVGDIYTESAHRARGGYVNLAYLIDKSRQEAETLGFDKTILLLSGDLLGGSSLCEITKGMHIIEILNILNVGKN